LTENTQPIGKVKFSHNEVLAISSGNQIRALNINSPVYLGDSIKTGEHGIVSISLTNGHIFDLGRNGHAVLDYELLETNPIKARADDILQTDNLAALFESNPEQAIDQINQLQATAAGDSSSTATNETSDSADSPAVISLTAFSSDVSAGYETTAPIINFDELETDILFVDSSLALNNPMSAISPGTGSEVSTVVDNSSNTTSGDGSIPSSEDGFTLPPGFNFAPPEEAMSDLPVRGTSGDDLLYAYYGDNQMEGYEGADTFFWDSSSINRDFAPDTDYLFDFDASEGDKLNFADILPDVDLSSLESLLLANWHDGHLQLQVSDFQSSVLQIVEIESIPEASTSASAADVMQSLIESDSIILI
jgi:hypothetical protein